MTTENLETDPSNCNYKPTLERSYRIESYGAIPFSREIHLIQIVPSPNVYVVPKFLTVNECQELIDLASRYWKPSLTSIGYALGPQKDYVNQSTKNRTSSSSRLPKAYSPLVSTIENRVCEITGSKWEYLEPLVVVRYHPNEYFNEHHDGFFRPLTVLIYLNEEFEEGETEFTYLGMKLKPQTGMAVIWNNIKEDGSPDPRLSHAGLPPLLGTKYVVNCFINNESQITF